MSFFVTLKTTFSRDLSLKLIINLKYIFTRMGTYNYLVIHEMKLMIETKLSYNDVYKKGEIKRAFSKNIFSRSYYFGTVRNVTSIGVMKYINQQ